MNERMIYYRTKGDSEPEINEIDSALLPINEPLPNIENVETKNTLTEEQVEQIVKLPNDAFTNVV